MGRFEQLRNFGSYNNNDSITADHALLGLKVINRSGTLSSLSKRERSITFFFAALRIILSARKERFRNEETIRSKAEICPRE
jgi:hypothetical protein